MIYTPTLLAGSSMYCLSTETVSFELAVAFASGFHVRSYGRGQSMRSQCPVNPAVTPVRP